MLYATDVTSSVKKLQFHNEVNYQKSHGNSDEH